DRPNPHMLCIEPGPKLLRQRLSRHAVTQLDEGLVLRLRSKPKKLGLVQEPRRDEDAGSERCSDAHIAGEVLERPGDQEASLAERERVADLRAERGKQ